MGFHRFLIIFDECAKVFIDFQQFSANVHWFSMHFPQMYLILMFMYTFHYMAKTGLHAFSMIFYIFSSIFNAFSWGSHDSWWMFMDFQRFLNKFYECAKDFMDFQQFPTDVHWFSMHFPQIYLILMFMYIFHYIAKTSLHACSIIFYDFS